MATVKLLVHNRISGMSANPGAEIVVEKTPYTDALVRGGHVTIVEVYDAPSTHKNEDLPQQNPGDLDGQDGPSGAGDRTDSVPDSKRGKGKS